MARQSRRWWGTGPGATDNIVDTFGSGDAGGDRPVVADGSGNLEFYSRSLSEIEDEIDGIVTFTWEGEWDSETEYEAGSVVRHQPDGYDEPNAYVATDDVNAGVEPPDGGWALLSRDITDHDHDEDYAAAGHDHDEDYADENHDHDADYAAVGHSLDDHGDVTTSSPSDGDVLTFDASEGEWGPQPVPDTGEAGNGGGAKVLGYTEVRAEGAEDADLDLTGPEHLVSERDGITGGDVTFTTPDSGRVLVLIRARGTLEWDTDDLPEGSIETTRVTANVSVEDAEGPSNGADHIRLMHTHRHRAWHGDLLDQLDVSYGVRLDTFAVVAGLPPGEEVTWRLGILVDDGGANRLDSATVTVPSEEDDPADDGGVAVPVSMTIVELDSDGTGGGLHLLGYTEVETTTGEEETLDVTGEQPSPVADLAGVDGGDVQITVPASGTIMVEVRGALHASYDTSDLPADDEIAQVMVYGGLGVATDDDPPEPLAGVSQYFPIALIGEPMTGQPSLRSTLITEAVTITGLTPDEEITLRLGALVDVVDIGDAGDYFDSGWLAVPETFDPRESPAMYVYEVIE